MTDVGLTTVVATDMRRFPGHNSADPLFRLTVEDLFVMDEPEVVVWGRVHGGVVRVQDGVQVALSSTDATATVWSIERLPGTKTVSEARPGEQVLLTLVGIRKEDIQPGDVIIGAK